MKPRIATTLALLVAGTAIFLMGRASVSPAPGASGETLEPRAPSRAVGAPGESSRSAGRGKSDRRPLTGDARRAKLEAILRTHDPADRTRALLGFLDQLSPSELQEAVEHFASLELSGDRSDELAMMLSVWTRIAPDAAVAWAQTQYAGDANSPYIAGVIGSLATTDLARATSLLDDLSAGKVLNTAMNRVLSLIRAQGDEATRGWISGLQGDPARSVAVDQVAKTFVLADAKTAATWLAATPCDAATRNLQMAVGTLAHKDSVAAIAIYEGMPAGEARSEALSGVIAALTRENPQTAASFLDNHPADVTHALLKQFAVNSIIHHPDLAFRYLDQIQDPEARAASCESAINTFVSSDLAAAKAYFQTHPRPDHLSDYARRMLDQELDP